MSQVKRLKEEDSGFPKRLKEIGNAPSELFCQGDLTLLESPAVAVVGSRKCSQYGISVAREIGRRCGECGITVVSGLAIGIDTAAHRGALESGGKTIAVLACGIDICYPRQNRNLFEEIKRKGLVFTEYSLGEPPVHYKFPMRNRLISGISDGVVVVEAGYRSGALITAEYAEEQGKTLYAVPSNITNPCGVGANQLIADGVRPLLVVEDLIRDFGIQGDFEIEEKKLGKDEKIVYEHIVQHSELTTDDLCLLTMFSPRKINGIITILEMKGLVVSAMGRVFVNVM